MEPEKTPSTAGTILGGLSLGCAVLALFVPVFGWMLLPPAFVLGVCGIIMSGNRTLGILGTAVSILVIPVHLVLMSLGLTVGAGSIIEEVFKNMPGGIHVETPDEVVDVEFKDGIRVLVREK